MSRLRAETMPAVTVPPRPNGLPIAITQSPSRILSESPNLTAFSGLSASPQHRDVGLLIAADHLGLQREPSVKTTVISSASAITWLLVTTMPDGSMTKPEPSD
jgi:hypothetical protein